MPSIRVREITAKTVLTKTGIENFSYCLNPYVGCQHACRYCYAAFMKRFTGHQEPWGAFIDVKINAPEVLARQLQKARKGTVLVSTVTDPYQPLEKNFHLTRDCLQALWRYDFPVNILTRSPLCLRDIDLFKQFSNLSIGLSLTTDKEEIRHLFEPHAPSIKARTEALRMLHRNGIRTYAFIGPLLPMNPALLVASIADRVDEVLIDRLNYPNKVKALYRRAGLEKYLHEEYFLAAGAALEESFKKQGVPVSMLL